MGPQNYQLIEHEAYYRLLEHVVKEEDEGMVKGEEEGLLKEEGERMVVGMSEDVSKAVSEGVSKGVFEGMSEGGMLVGGASIDVTKDVVEDCSMEPTMLIGSLKEGSEGLLLQEDCEGLGLGLGFSLKEGCEEAVPPIHGRFSQIQLSSYVDVIIQESVYEEEGMEEREWEGDVEENETKKRRITESTVVETYNTDSNNDTTNGTI